MFKWFKYGEDKAVFDTDRFTTKEDIDAITNSLLQIANKLHNMDSVKVYDIVYELLKKGADPTASDWWIIQMASLTHNAKLVKLLLKYVKLHKIGTKPTTAQKQKYQRNINACLLEAMKLHDTYFQKPLFDTLTELLMMGASPKADNWKPINLAVSSSNTKLLQFLLGYVSK